MIIHRNLALLLLTLIALSSCKTAREANTATSKNYTARSLLDQMIRQQVQADWLEARTKIEFEDEDRKLSATATIKLRKDSLLWMSVRKLGFEIARAQVTQDSVYMINRLTNEYMVKDLNYLAREYNLPADLRTLQSVILGNPIFLQTRDLKLTTAEGTYQLTGQSEHWENRFWLDRQNLHLMLVGYDDLRQRRNLTIQLEDYRELNTGQNFSYLRQIAVDSRELGEAQVIINFTDVEINTPQEIRFSIPSRYSRVD